MSVLDYNELIKKCKIDNDAMLSIIKQFERKISSSLYQTNVDNREDLRQDLLVKLITAIKKYDLNSVPGFWDLRNQIQSQT